MSANLKPFVLEIKGLTKYYRHSELPALRNIHLTVWDGQHVGLVGANGSGKTTLMRCVLGLLSYQEGNIRLGSNDSASVFNRQVGYVAEAQEGLENFTCRELLHFAGRMQGMSSEDIIRRTEELLHWTGLQDRADELVGGFSKGMMQKTALACALIHRPKVLLLDEPMNGLDPASRKRLRELLLELEDVTIMLSSHNLEEVERVCQRVVILHGGEIKGDVDLREGGPEIFCFRVNTEIDTMLQSYPDITLSDKSKISGGWQYELQTDSGKMQRLLTDLGKKEISIKGLRSSTRLEILYEKFVR